MVPSGIQPASPESGKVGISGWAEAALKAAVGPAPKPAELRQRQRQRQQHPTGTGQGCSDQRYEMRGRGVVTRGMSCWLTGLL